MYSRAIRLPWDDYRPRGYQYRNAHRTYSGARWKDRVNHPPVTRMSTARKNAKRQHGDALTSVSAVSETPVQFTVPVKTLWPLASFCQRSYQSQSSLISAGTMLWPRPFVTLYRTTFTPAALFHL